MRKYQSIRIFKSPILEACTHVHPITPLILWSPIIFFLFQLSWGMLRLDEMLILSLMGLLTWTLTEYIMHRFLFHFNGKSKVSQYLVFLFHGLHHDDPNDPTRLVMPPVPGLILASLFYFMFSFMMTGFYLNFFFGFFLIGYLLYDYIHYATHHFPMRSRVGKFLKKHHIMHHNKCSDAKFGVSNPIWDYVFKTYYSKKK